MDFLKNLLDAFVAGSKSILRENLVGIYLHGSAAMGCFNPNKSDLDLLVVVSHDLSRETKRAFMEMVMQLNQQAPAKGIEMSIVKEAVCNPFVYPTPFELHFSVMHLGWYQSDPDGYIENMHGTDPDLAAHFTIIYHRGITLFGKEIPSVFAKVDKAAYMDSIRADIENAPEEILDNPIYLTLNLCRVLAYKRDELIVSKLEGGEWGLKSISEPDYQMLISSALRAYQSEESMTPDPDLAKGFAGFMLEQIND